MAATRSDIQRWITEGKNKGATHTIIACDTYDHEDYPVHVMPGQDPRARAKNLGEMQMVMEVYSHKLDHAAQLAEHRAFHYD